MQRVVRGRMMRSNWGTNEARSDVVSANYKGTNIGAKRRSECLCQYGEPPTGSSTALLVFRCIMD